MTRPAAPEPGPDERRPGLLEWLGVFGLCLCGALAALLEALLVPLYAGSVVVPIAVVLALATNIILPRLAVTLVPRPVAAALPFVAWLIVIIAFGVVTRPEGDVILPGAPKALEYVTYGVLLGGALAGAVSVVTAAPPPRPRPRPGPSAARPAPRGVLLGRR
jgi:hypothetical protein